VRGELEAAIKVQTQAVIQGSLALQEAVEAGEMAELRLATGLAASRAQQEAERATVEQNQTVEVARVRADVAKVQDAEISLLQADLERQALEMEEVLEWAMEDVVQAGHEETTTRVQDAEAAHQRQRLAASERAEALQGRVTELEVQLAVGHNARDVAEASLEREQCRSASLEASTAQEKAQLAASFGAAEEEVAVLQDLLTAGGRTAEVLTRQLEEP
jgi:DNA-directed RNA polymerase beta subunit